MHLLKSILLGILFLWSTTHSLAQSMSKSYKTVEVAITIDAPAEKVWQTMVLDYGAISNFSPYIYSSHYVNGSLKGEQGAQRTCAFNEKGTQWVQEEIKAIDYENRTIRNVPMKGEKLPLNFDNSQAFYKVVDNGDGTTTAAYEFQYRTKPGFLSGLVKGSFEKQLIGTLIGLKHYVETGEKVTPENGKYEEIKAQYDEQVMVL